MKVRSLAGKAALAGAILAAAFFYGAYMILAGTAGGVFLGEAFIGGIAYYTKLSFRTPPELHYFLWPATRYKETGVTLHDGDLAYNGYTFVTNGEFSGAQLLDMKGGVAHQWRLPFSKAFPGAPHIEKPSMESWIYWRKAWLFPNGDVLAVYESCGDTPYGYGMVKVDKDSNILWTAAQRLHHDVWVDEEGMIYALGHEIVNEHPAGLEFIGKPYILDYILILTPEGREVKRISILDAFMNSEYSSEMLKLKHIRQNKGDIFHMNTLRVIPGSLEGAAPFLKKGLILTASRSMSSIGLIDPDRGEFVWLQKGLWKYLHDPEFSPDGTVTLVDNVGTYIQTRSSQVLRYDPRDMSIAWSFGGSQERPFFTEVRGSKQLLPNGNILVTESDGGRIFEVTRDKRMVWEYINPQRRDTEEGEKTAVLCGAKRFLPEQLPFLQNKSLADGKAD